MTNHTQEDILYRKLSGEHIVVTDYNMLVENNLIKVDGIYVTEDILQCSVIDDVNFSYSYINISIVLLYNIHFIGVGGEYVSRKRTAGSGKLCSSNCFSDVNLLKLICSAPSDVLWKMPL